MKRLVSVICLCAALCMAAAASAEHLLWNVPFGSTIEECKAAAMANAGIVLEDATDYAGNAYLKTMDGRTVTMFGLPAQVQAKFSDNGLSRFQLILSKGGGGYYERSDYVQDGAKLQLIDNALRAYQGVLAEASASLGAPTGGDMATSNDGDNWQSQGYPSQGSMVDVEAVKSVFAGAENGRVTTSFGNVKIRCSYVSNSDPTQQFSRTTIYVYYER